MTAMSSAALRQLRDALRGHRLDRNLSYDELAAAIGVEKVSPATVRRFIESETEPHQTTAHAIEQYLKAQGVAA